MCRVGVFVLLVDLMKGLKMVGYSMRNRVVLSVLFKFLVLLSQDLGYFGDFMSMNWLYLRHVSAFVRFALFNFLVKVLGHRAFN